MAVRPRFDPNRDFVAARGFTFNGVEHATDAPFDKSVATATRLAMLYASRMINFAPDGAAGPVDPVQVEKAGGGYFNVTAPWLDEPIRSRGLAKANEEADKLRAAGPPLGWIEGGTAIRIEDLGGGWYELNAPWFDEPVKVQGREAAELQQRALHAAGEPVEHHGVTLTEGENGWWEVSANWDPNNVAKVHGEAEARELATKWRAEGPARDYVTVTPGVDEDQFIITMAWSEDTETVEGEEAANARADELRAEGPPEGWEPPAPTE